LKKKASLSRENYAKAEDGRAARHYSSLARLSDRHQKIRKKAFVHSGKAMTTTKSDRDASPTERALKGKGKRRIARGPHLGNSFKEFAKKKKGP